MCKSNITDCRWISHRNGLCLFLTHCTDVEVGNSPEFTSAMVDCGDAQHSEFDILLSFYRLLDIDFSKWPLDVNFIVFTVNIFSWPFKMSKTPNLNLTCMAIPIHV